MLSWTQTILIVLAFLNCTSLPTHIARHARIPSSSPTPALALTLTILTRLSSLRPKSPLPAWIACYHGFCAMPVQAIVVAALTSTELLATSFVSALANQLTAMQGDASQRAIDCLLSWDFCATRTLLPTAHSPIALCAYRCRFTWC
eukprot:1718848-Pleurochrysis_carterae.AAC.1